MLRAYDEREAELGRRGALSDRRIELRARFIATRDAENRTSVLDVGAGPAQDGSGFVDAGFGYLAIDLAHENGRRSRARGFDFTQASAPALALRTGSFDAGWSMSTLMHLDDTTAVRPSPSSLGCSFLARRACWPSGDTNARSSW